METKNIITILASIINLLLCFVNLVLLLLVLVILLVVDGKKISKHRNNCLRKCC
jgi:hypothetical protein